MRYEVLGPLRVLGKPGSPTISARKVKILLSVLLIRADQLVTTDRLMEEIWDGEPPRRATTAMHVYVSQLRKFLVRPDVAGSPIVTRPGGYLLRRGDDELDLHDFQKLVQRGRTDVRAGRHAEAVENFDAALRMGRGPVLADLRESGMIAGFVTWIEEMRLECLEARIDSALVLGRHRELVGQLYSLTAEHPQRESFHRQLMLALYRSERQADALHAYRRVRDILRGELGLDPGRALRELHDAILAADGRLDLRRAG
ncbi:AfsR/SARP family transcriptional regulator [Frankia sp. CNm7]|uniref:AfsR/SARP family transcriptional regulator n=1 Tax=Frankia nepalensis TaxID=1836974 RepID=A0A937RQW2_9ACTN|nr:AfsR/SARP family transcriptional regulator [Frankia nepalensis]MBL7497609.1 AfsR/SARP family transcriptional regulator [Frankia nepalensis]MBL7511795.1 AfsR/SARP family transcriptional regulator [Frankia nepalensis]MBL7518606.1 AfsR/SARP family transcriptional regulator [Frankia nepalensis]MBL7633259.1 AfsR/SARP family transcriptional regulator [Frankia nepalensis]